jgi:hypothetical protein
MDALNDDDASRPIPFKIGSRVICDPVFHRLSRELAYARLRAHLLQRVVAKRMGTTTSAISRLEKLSDTAPR